MALAVWLFVALQRLAEGAWGRRSARRLKAQGGVEHGAAHFPLFVVLHAAWLAAMLPWAWEGAVSPPFLMLYGIVLAGRVWIMVSLGARWTTRVVTLPHAPLVRRGPYRRLRHPNYLIVTAEIAIVPLIFGAWPVAVGFSLANALLLRLRIRVEDAALARSAVAFAGCGEEDRGAAEP